MRMVRFEGKQGQTTFSRSYANVLVHEEADPAAAVAKHAPGALDAAGGPGGAFRESACAEAAVSRGSAARRVRHGLLLGRRAPVLEDPWRVLDRGRLRRRRHAEPDLRGSVLGIDQPRRSGAGGL